MLATYQWSLLWDYRSDFFHGLWVAIEVAIVAMILSVIMGIILAAARMSKGPVSWAAVAYINIFRGVPALVSVIWVYFGWSLLLGINFTVFQAAVSNSRQRSHSRRISCRLSNSCICWKRS